MSATSSPSSRRTRAPMPSPSRFATRLSTNARGLLVGCTVGAALLGAFGLAFDSYAVAVAGLIGSTAFFGAFAVYLIVTERRRHEFAEDELQEQSTFLESLVDSIAAVSSTLDAGAILERTCDEAKRLFDAREARLLEEAREREAERARLTERLITAEQDERRRLSLFLHDGPLQNMSGIALMHDAALAAIRDGRFEDAATVIERSLEKERDTIRTLRDLSFAIEPLVLRDEGFRAAVRALGDGIEDTYRITVATDVEAGGRLAEKAQVALYQIIREGVNQAVRRRPQRIEVAVRELEDGGYETEIADDGVVERRRASIEAIDERVKILNGRLSVDHGEQAGALVRVVVPSYVAAAEGPH